ncbi:N-acetyltransferase [Isoptericola sp. BMS4]|uniref:GNAT family N-acetyltransferase n=1 Tax=Isoptericola sp. BMS4 TaxID=2527875 RepID=UPI001F116CA4|nr:GNAT family N-acetyltransferase [Isoptericola sp. BMS4]
MTTAAAHTPAVRAARPEEAAELAWLAALTFPLACPAGTPVATMAAHIADRLSPVRFRTWARSPEHALLVAAGTGDVPEPVGYALVSFGLPDGAAERDALLAATGDEGPYAELSKIYVHPGAQGSGVAGALMDASVAAAAALAVDHGHPGAPLWLGTNGENARAQAFYRKHGFDVVGRRTYEVGGVQHDDVVMLRAAS